MSTTKIITLINKRISELQSEHYKYQDAKSFDDRSYLATVKSTLKINILVLEYIKKNLPTLED